MTRDVFGYTDSVMKIIFSLFLVLNFASSACAYLDPASGSMFLQMVLAALAGLLFAVKIMWRRISSFLGFGANDRERPPGRESNDSLP